MPPLKLKLSTSSNTIHLGKIIGSNLFAGAVVGLTGELGTGKTTMVTGIAEGMGIDQDYIVSSPTYTLMQIYPCAGRQLYHLDLYRISGSGDLDSTGYRDAMSGDDILVVEWPEREPEVIPGHHLTVKLDYSGDSRLVTLSGVGENYEQLLTKIEREMKMDL